MVYGGTGAGGGAGNGIRGETLLLARYAHHTHHHHHHLIPRTRTYYAATTIDNRHHNTPLSAATAKTTIRIVQTSPTPVFRYHRCRSHSHPLSKVVHEALHEVLHEAEISWVGRPPLPRKYFRR
jgi:hypothetical protein